MTLAPEHRIALYALAIVVTLGGIVSMIVTPADADFHSFYDSGAAWLRGDSPYTAIGDDPNLNPPSVVSFVFAPLARLPLRLAAGVWTLLGVLALSLSAWLIARAVPQAGWPHLALLSVLPGSMFAWAEGQMTWLLLLPTTLAWLAYRRHQPWLAGAWLAPLIAAKPFFALMVLPLGLPMTVAAGLGSAAISALGVLVTGIQPWRDWLEMSHVVTWLGHPANASVPGIMARALSTGAQDRIGLASFGPWSLLLWGGSALVLLGCVWRMPQADADAKWTAALLGAIPLAPLGWCYYLPLAAGSIMAGRWHRSLVALFMPLPVLGLLLDPPWLFRGCSCSPVRGTHGR
jgi:hypothetical protein